MFGKQKRVSGRGNEQRRRDYASLWPPFSLAALIRPHAGVSGNMFLKIKKVHAKVDSRIYERWRLRVMGSWLSLLFLFSESFSDRSLAWCFIFLVQHLLLDCWLAGLSLTACKIFITLIVLPMFVISNNVQKLYRILSFKQNFGL